MESSSPGRAALKSYIATVTIVPPTGSIVGSNFLLGNEDWVIVGNKAQPSAKAVFEPYSRGPMLNRYIMGTDDKIHASASTMHGISSGASPSSKDVDTALWYFSAPNKFLGNKGISYGGELKFTLSAFSGDFSKTNGDVHLVELECASCIGPVGKGILLALPISGADVKFDGKTAQITIQLLENKGWLKDTQNVLLRDWSAPSQCDMIQVLSRLSAIRILGDHSNWYETVAIDDVAIVNSASKLPICAMARPDASVCECGAK